MKELEAATADAWEDGLAAGDGPALGRDPFEEATPIDPFVARLERVALAGPHRARRAPRNADGPAARSLPMIRGRGQEGSAGRPVSKHTFGGRQDGKYVRADREQSPGAVSMPGVFSCIDLRPNDHPLRRSGRASRH